MRRQRGAHVLADVAALRARVSRVNPHQYQLFRLSVSWHATFYINMIATATVDVILLDSDDRGQYESGNEYTDTR
jgi:hypothetical protein